VQRQRAATASWAAYVAMHMVSLNRRVGTGSALTDQHSTGWVRSNEPQRLAFASPLKRKWLPGGLRTCPQFDRGLRLFFYHEAKEDYLAKLAETRRGNHELTPFLIFALGGVEAEVSRLIEMLQHEVSKEMFRNFVNELVVRLASTRKRIIIKRQLALLGYLLDKDQAMEVLTLATELHDHYRTRKYPSAALTRNLVRLEALGAVRVAPATNGAKGRFVVSVNLDWPSSMTETEFFRKVSELPKSNNYSLLTH